MFREQNKPEEKAEFKPCSNKDCTGEGIYQAPKMREFEDRPRKAHDYHWFCKEHIREYNKKWDFFSGMNEEEVQQFQKESVTGHRPTNKWQLDGSPSSVWQWNESVRKFADQFFDDYDYQEMSRPKLPKNIQTAADTLDITLPETIREVKKQYKLLVKQYHPDVNKGCKASEEKFKAVNEAYHLIVECDFVIS